MEPMSPKNNSTTADRFPCSRLSRPQSTISQSDFHPIIGPFSPHRLGRPYKLALEPDGSPLFPLIPLVACWRYEPREHPRPLALARPAIPPSPLSDRVGYSDHVRFRGYLPVHWCSSLQPPCLRFAAAVTGRHARRGTRLLARLCRRRHLRRLSSTRLQGATLIEPDMRISRIRLSDKTSRSRVRRPLHGKPHCVIRDDQPDAREGQAGRFGVAERQLETFRCPRDATP